LKSHWRKIVAAFLLLCIIGLIGFTGKECHRLLGRDEKIGQLTGSALKAWPSRLYDRLIDGRYNLDKGVYATLQEGKDFDVLYLTTAGQESFTRTNGLKKKLEAR
jgi:hypothetical protein